jgi:hypothetical protein
MVKISLLEFYLYPTCGIIICYNKQNKKKVIEREEMSVALEQILLFL